MHGLLGVLDHLAALAYFVFVVGGLLGAAIRPIRGICGFALYVASFAIGLDVWFWSLVTVHDLWGTVAVVIGLLLAGVGVAPMALIATVIHGDWTTFAYILINLMIVYFCRMAGAALIEKS